MFNPRTVSIFVVLELSIRRNSVIERTKILNPVSIFVVLELSIRL